MAGITNRPKRAEVENQKRVERQKSRKAEQVVARDKVTESDERGRVSETGVGRGPDHEGH